METQQSYNSQLGLPSSSPLPSPMKEEVPDVVTSIFTNSKEMEIKPHSRSVFAFDNISYTVKDKKAKKNGEDPIKTLLMSVRGAVGSGEVSLPIASQCSRNLRNTGKSSLSSQMMAIMGPSSVYIFEHSRNAICWLDQIVVPANPPYWTCYLSERLSLAKEK